MKIVLVAINAKYIHSNPAVYSLKAYAGDNRNEIEIAEYTINNRREDIISDLYRKNPEVLAFSCYIWNWELIKSLFADLKKILPNVIIWLGGPEVSFEADKILEKHSEIEGIMLGEGEETFQQLTCYYVDKAGEIGQISGIITRNEKTMSREPMCMDQVPFLYDEPEKFENKILYYESSRGCPFRCSYCLSSIDKTVRLRSLDLVKKELKLFLDRKVKQVKFVDRTFNCNHEHAISIWKYILENDNEYTNFHFEISADLINEEELKILSQMRPGLVQLEIGVQSTNPETLKEINRYVKMERLRLVVAEINGWHNIHIHLDLIAGLPFENFESFANSFCEVYEMKPDQLQLGFLKVLKGSKMYDNVEQYGIIYSSIPPYEVFQSKWISYGEILQLKSIEEMVEIYYNSNQYRTTLKLLQSCFTTPFVMFQELGKFYEKNQYHIQTPSRIARYDVLLEFAQEMDMNRVEIYKETLTYDCYLRENMKSRPSFSSDPGLIKELIKEARKTNDTAGKQMHIEMFTYPVWESVSRMEIKLETPKLVMFNYIERDPLTYEASVNLL